MSGSQLTPMAQLAGWHFGTPSATMASIHATPQLCRMIDPDVAEAILECIREPASSEIYYMSMNDSKMRNPRWRRVSPHALGFDGNRAYVRAFCHVDEKFKDFALCRALKTRRKARAGADSQSDIHWHQLVEVVLVANPRLSANQKRAVALEYELEKGRRVVLVRQSMLIYLKRQLRLDPIACEAPPTLAPLRIENIAVVDAAMACAAR